MNIVRKTVQRQSHADSVGNVRISGNYADGETLSAALLGGTPQSVAYQWQMFDGAGWADIDSATAATYTQSGAIAERIRCLCTPSYTLASNELVGLAAPRAVGSLDDLFLLQDSGDQTVDAGPCFSGTGLTYSVTGHGAAIDPVTGMVTHETTTACTAETVTVTALNAAGAAQQSYRITITGTATAPLPFAAGDWRVDAGDAHATVTVWTLPPDGGDPVSAIEYRVDGGAWQDSGRAAPGSFDIAGLVNDQDHAIELRAVNGIGAGSAGGSKSVTPAAPATTPILAVPDQSVVSGTGPFTLDLATFVTDDGGDPAISYGLTPQAGVSLAGSILSFADSVGTYSVAVQATNTGGTTAAGFDFEVQAALVAPTVTASDGLAGRTLTITVDSLTGNPAPSVALTTLTLDGVDVSGDATGSGPWSYVVPDSSSAQTVAWEVTATNSEGNDTASGSEVVTANLSVPAQTAAPSLSDTTPRPGATVTITEGTYTGTPAPTISGTLTLDGVDVSGDMVGADYTVPTGTHGEALVWSETATNAAGSDGPNAATGTVTADAPSLAVPDQSVVSGTGPFTLDLATFVSDDGGDGSITYGLTPQAGVSLAGSVLSFTDSVGTYSGVAVSATNAGGTTGDTLDFEITAAPDVTAPVLSLPTGAAQGETGATALGVTTDEAGGMLHWGLYPAAGTPSAADVVAGTGAIVSGAQAVSAPGAQAVADQSGLTAATAYRAHYVHEDAASNRSNLATSAGFTTDAAATAPAQVGAGDWSVASGDEQAIVTITALPANGGAAITAIEYQLDGGAWQDSGRTTTGAFTITGLTNLIEYQVALRAVNAVGNGTASATKAVTPAEGTMSLQYGGDGTPTVGLVDGSDVTIDIDGTPHVVAVADLDDGFELLTPCTTSGTDGVGNVWTAVPGLYAYDPAEGAPIIGYQWVRQGIDIPGATNATYTQQAGDAAAGLKVKLWFTNAQGTFGPYEADAIVLSGAVVAGYTGTMIETEDASYFYKTLITDGTLSFSAGGTVDIEGIGGGGGGGQDRGGGGGAGARVVITDAVVTATSYAAVIGTAGVGGVDGASPSTNGSATTFDAGGSVDLLAAGGGAGGAVDGGNGVVAQTGGCGGGGARTAPGAAGTLGGAGGDGATNDAGGGGGGMGGAGGNSAAGPLPGAGGAGVTGFLGDTVCEGGDGGNLTNAFDPTAPTDAGCGGRGGNRNGVAGTRHGANGAPGRVVIRIAK